MKSGDRDGKNGNVHFEPYRMRPATLRVNLNFLPKRPCAKNSYDYILENDKKEKQKTR